MRKARRHTLLPGKPGCHSAPTACRHMVSGSYPSPSRGSFHLSVTLLGSLSVVREYLALRDGPRRFSRGSTCPDLLRYPPGGDAAVAYGAVTRYGLPFQCSSASRSLSDSHVEGPTTPQGKTPAVWALSFSLAATGEIEFSFFSNGYLDVSVHRVGGIRLWIQRMLIRESRDQRSFDNSPGLIAVFHALHRLLTPRHPPCALSSLAT